MGQFTYEQISQMENPFEQLGSADALAEHAAELNQLKEQDMVAVASRMVRQCPEEEFEDFSRHGIKALENQGNFYFVLDKAINIRQLSISLLDTKNPAPHRGLTGRDFDGDLFNQFPELFHSLIANQEVMIAQRFAECIPDMAVQSELLRNIGNIQATELARLTGIAFQLHHHIQTKLLSDTPEEFFKSREFNLDNSHQFLPLICKLIEGKEQAIGEKLAKALAKDLTFIPSVLEQLKENAADTKSQFKTIAETFNAHVESRTQDMKSQDQQTTQGPGAQGLFAPSELRRRTASVSASQSDTIAEEQDNPDFDNNHRSGCNPCSII